MCILATIAQYVCFIGGNICSPLHCSVLPYIHTYIPLRMCLMLIFFCIRIFYLYYPIFYIGTSMCYLKYFFRLLVPATNIHITYVRSIYMLLVTVFGRSNSL